MNLKEKLAKQRTTGKSELRKPLEKLVVLNEAKLAATQVAARGGCGMCG